VDDYPEIMARHHAGCLPLVSCLAWGGGGGGGFISSLHSQLVYSIHLGEARKPKVYVWTLASTFSVTVRVSDACIHASGACCFKHLQHHPMSLYCIFRLEEVMATSLRTSKGISNEVM
jgi:hypothetical protein